MTIPLRAVVRMHVLAVLTACNGNKEKAARELGISRRGLMDMLRRWGVREEWRGSGVPRPEKVHRL